eukprot:TRINITY_DN10174_c0_g1_i1.p1 TRINITY_DN10174_c0_g1~~TRINITY_DN10174_c0_g1_i1.p1  ORF type:complete len:396 (+),score=57.66 TRINITY_DN10174_c0_g1_i1:418-1605(+)
MSSPRLLFLLLASSVMTQVEEKKGIDKVLKDLQKDEKKAMDLKKKLRKYSLRMPFVFWKATMHQRARGLTQRGYLSQLQRLDTMRDLGDCFSLIASVAPSFDLTGSSVHFFRAGIRPTWEDRKNRAGGMITAFYALDQSEQAKNDFLRFALFLSMREEPLLNDVTGCSYKLGQNGIVLRFWNKGGTDAVAVDKLCTYFADFTGKPRTEISYKPHKKRIIANKMCRKPWAAKSKGSAPAIAPKPKATPPKTWNDCSAWRSLRQPENIPQLPEVVEPLVTPIEYTVPDAMPEAPNHTEHSEAVQLIVENGIVESDLQVVEPVTDTVKCVPNMSPKPKRKRSKRRKRRKKAPKQSVPAQQTPPKQNITAPSSLMSAVASFAFPVLAVSVAVSSMLFYA